MNALVMNCSPVRDGATAEICRIIADEIRDRFTVKSVCIDDFSFGFCLGCRSCHETAQCVQDDDLTEIMDLFSWADTIVCVSLSYWADVPGQFKAFIDRCTPWCNTHEPHATLPSGKRGHSIALRTGPGMHECERIHATIEHFYGHLEIERCGCLGLCSIEFKEQIASRMQEILEFCATI